MEGSQLYPSKQKGKNERADISEIEQKHIIKKINKVRSWFSEKTNKIEKPIEGVIKKKTEAQISDVKNEKGAIPTYASDRGKNC